MKTEEPPKPVGFTCEKCGNKHDYPAYVYAHWTIPLIFTCPHCGTRYDIENGVATVAAPGK